MTKAVISIIIIILVIVAGFVVYKYSQPPSESINNGQIIQDQEGQKTPAQEPKIEVSPDAYDFGRVIYGDVAEHTFNITNAGNQPLEILRLSTSCGCTQAVMAEKDKSIAPGASATLKVTFDPAVMKANPDLGRVMRVVYIKSNDPNNSEIEVNIQALVVKAE